MCRGSRKCRGSVSCRMSHAVCGDLGVLDIFDNDDADNVGVHKGIFG